MNSIDYTVTRGIRRKDKDEDFEVCACDDSNVNHHISVSFDEDDNIVDINVEKNVNIPWCGKNDGLPPIGTILARPKQFNTKGVETWFDPDESALIVVGHHMDGESFFTDLTNNRNSPESLARKYMKYINKEFAPILSPEEQAVNDMRAIVTDTYNKLRHTRRIELPDSDSLDEYLRALIKNGFKQSK